MKFSLLTILFALALALAPRAAAQQRPSPAKDEPATEEFALERRTEVEARAVVSLCMDEGDVIVRGWDRNEVRARAEGQGTLRLLTPNVRTAPHVEVLVSEEKDAELSAGHCGTSQTIELTVPRGATVEIESRTGHVEVSDVAEARIKVLSGDVDVRRISRAVEVSCLSGDVSVSDSTGPVHVESVSGDVEARNLRTTSAGDNFEAKSTSGDVMIEAVGHGNVTGAAVSGQILYTGALARGGSYDFRTISGDVMLELPANASFNLHAKVVVSGEIVTDFPVKTSASASASASAGPVTMPPAPPAPPAPVAGVAPPAPPVHVKKGQKVKIPKEHESARLDGTVGTGDAVVNLSSFSGSLHLRKR
jgi:putative adhesin